MKKKQYLKLIIIFTIIFFLLMIPACNDKSDRTDYNNIIPGSFDKQDEAINISVVDDEDTIEDLIEPYTIPIITRKDKVRVRTHPSFLADVVSMMDRGTRLTITKRTGETDTSVSGKSYYWFYVKTGDEDYKHTRYQPGWVYGGDIEGDDYELPFINNLPIVNRFEEAEALIIANILYKYFIIEQDNTTLRYAPDLYSSPVYSLNRGNRINLTEKSAFKQYSPKSDKPYRWLYAVYKKDDKRIGGWIPENLLPDTITDEHIRQLPVNNVYRHVSEKPVYIGEAFADTSGGDKPSIQINIFSAMLSDGIFNDVNYSKGYQDKGMNGKQLWMKQNITDTVFYLYEEGNYIGTARPEADFILKAKERGLLSEDMPVVPVVIEQKEEILQDVPIMAFSEKVAQGELPLEINPHKTSSKQEAGIKSILGRELRNAFYDEFGVTVDEEGYYQSYNIDLSPIKFNQEDQFLYLADIRLLGNESGIDSFVFRQVGLLNMEGERNIVDSLFKRVESLEEANFITAYHSITGVIDLDSQDGKEEAIIRMSDINLDKIYKIISPSDNRLIIVFE